MLRIEFESLPELAPDALRALLPGVGKACLEQEGISGKYLVGLRLVDDEEMQSLNRETRKVDRTTDVLSFPAVDYPAGKTARQVPQRLRRELVPETGELFLGDLIISLPRISEQARAYGHSFYREAGYLLAHGMFHLLGYDHEQEAEREAMRALEEGVLERVGLLREGLSDDALRMMAWEARRSAYAPYSAYAVGACLLTGDGRLFTGCNVENAAYGMSICAERTALVKAISAGASDLVMIAIAAEGAPPYPCGACRQMLYEFAPALRVLVAWQGGMAEERLDALLPHGFGGIQKRERDEGGL